MCVLIMAGLVAWWNPQPAVAQAPASGLAGEIIQARQKNDALVRQYSWECRTDVLLDGVSKDLRIEQVNYGPGGLYTAYAQMDAPATGIAVQVQNFDYINQNY